MFRVAAFSIVQVGPKSGEPYLWDCPPIFWLRKGYLLASLRESSFRGSRGWRTIRVGMKDVLSIFRAENRTKLVAAAVLSIAAIAVAESGV